MQEIKCPHCNKSFTMDEAGYADILGQVRTAEFEKDLHERLEAADKQKVTEIALAEAKLAEKLKEEATKKDAELAELKARLENFDTDKKLAVQEAKTDIEKERDQLKNDLEKAEMKSKLEEKALKEKLEAEIRFRDGEIESLKNFKAKLGSKLLGETLEQHCRIEFDRIRATAFPRAYFEKDTNDSKTNLKGDFVFRDFDDEKVEILSIMFEMKNESDTTGAKGINSKFFKKLDDDRKRKGCEYAILVSVLEPESELYNTGIVDVSHEYEKMYVIRPQFFIPIITVLRNAALKSMDYKTELELVKAQNIDITDFEDRLDNFKAQFLKNYGGASKKFHDAIKQIDNSIKALETVKASLLGSEESLAKTNKGLEKMTIQALTKGNATMAAKFKELES
jgi:hypothetical protein